MTDQEIKKTVVAMSLEEKAGLCSGADVWHTKSVERLNIPAIWLTDGPHGLRKQEKEGDHLGIYESKAAVSFPSESTAACSFDRALLQDIGRELGAEGVSENLNVLLGPGVNIKRSPLCGRNFEYFSEDPYLSGELGAAYVEGVQSQGIGACVKHFLANNQETRRMTSSSEVDERTLREIYMPAFEHIVKKAKPCAVMCSYNKINGTFASESRAFMTDVLRKEWGFEGTVVSDWGAIHDRVKAVAAGTDLTMPGEPQTDGEIVEAVKSGRLPEFLLDTACENILRLIDKTYHERSACPPDFERGHGIARRAAAESAVLLKNEGNILPLSHEQEIAFIGQFAENPRYQGTGSSHVNPYRVSGALESVKAFSDIVYCRGYDGGDTTENLIAEAVQIAEEADVAVVFAGLTDDMEAEGGDRKHLRLSNGHNELIGAVAAVQPNTVVVLHNGGAVEMPWLDRVKGVLEMYLGGEAVGEACVDLLFGEANPCGRLAETFPIRLEDNPSYLWYFGSGDTVEYREGVYVGYRWYESREMPVLFPFGYGLSYTEFTYSDMRMEEDTFDADGNLHISVDVTNTGRRGGKEVVQLYVAVKNCEVLRPLKELKGFEKIFLESGETKKVCFTLTKRDFACWDSAVHAFVTPDGEYEIQIGKSVADIVLSARFCLKNSEPRKKAITMMSLISDFAAHPAGQQFLESHFSDLYQGIVATGIAKQMFGKDISMEEMKGMMAGLYSQPLQTLTMFLPNVQKAEWDRILQFINGAEQKI